MKFFRILFPTILMIVLIGCSKDRLGDQEPSKPSVEQIDEWLKTLPGVYSVQELKATEYKKCYLIQFKQPLDHKNPAAGTFLQRVYLNHENFDSPMVIEAEGYNVTDYSQQAQTELTKHYKANRVIVEHRYAGQSAPSPCDWDYLTCENAAGDLHLVREALGAAYTGSWVATGSSKGGSNTMSYMMHYPNDLAAAVAYVGPINNGVQDPRFQDFMKNIATPQMRAKVVNFQREVLIRRDEIQPIFFPLSAAEAASLPKEPFTADKAYELGVIDIAQEIWQYGWPIDGVPMTDATTEQIIDYLKKIKAFGYKDDAPKFLLGRDEEREPTFLQHYLRRFREQSSSKVAGSEFSYLHYYVLVLKEFGGPAFYLEPFEDLIPDHKSWSVNTLARFSVPPDLANIQYSDVWSRKMNQWLQNSDPKLMCIYGEYDPWTAAAPDNSYFASKSNMAIFVEAGGSHYACIERLSATDKQKAWSKLDTWVK